MWDENHIFFNQQFVQNGNQHQNSNEDKKIQNINSVIKQQIEFLSKQNTCLISQLNILNSNLDCIFTKYKIPQQVEAIKQQQEIDKVQIQESGLQQIQKKVYKKRLNRKNNQNFEDDSDEKLEIKIKKKILKEKEKEIVQNMLTKHSQLTLAKEIHHFEQKILCSVNIDIHGGIKNFWPDLKTLQFSRFILQFFNNPDDNSDNSPMSWHKFYEQKGNGKFIKKCSFCYKKALETLPDYKQILYSKYFVQKDTICNRMAFENEDLIKQLILNCANIQPHQGHIKFWPNFDVLVDKNLHKRALTHQIRYRHLYFNNKGVNQMCYSCYFIVKYGIIYLNQLILQKKFVYFIKSMINKKMFIRKDFIIEMINDFYMKLPQRKSKIQNDFETVINDENNISVSSESIDILQLSDISSEHSNQLLSNGSHDENIFFDDHN